MRLSIDLQVLALAIFAFSACDKQATTSEEPEPRSAVEPMTVEQPFPDQARIEAMAAVEVETPLHRTPVAAFIERWAIDPAWANADYLAPYEGSDPDSSKFAAIAREREFVPTAAMTCVAHELARFNLATKETSSTEDVRAFVLARCGVPFPGVAWKLFELPKRNSTIDALNLDLDRVPAGTHIGAAAARDGERGVFVIVHAYPEIAIDPIPFTAGGDGHVVLRGSTASPSSWMQATITQGPLGYAACGKLPTDREDGFAFDCPTQPDDALAMIELSAAPQRQLLGNVIARALVSPNGSAPAEYVVPTLSLPVSEGDWSPGALVASVNALRTQAKLDDVRTVPAQNDVAQNLLPLLLGSDDHAMRYEASLGLLAGWQTGATIRDAGLRTTVGQAALPLARLFAANMFSPSFRGVALSPTIDVLAVASLEDQDLGARALLFAAYEEFEPSDFRAEKLAVLAALDDQRAQVGLPPIVRVEGSNDEATLQESADRIRTGESHPRQELDAMLHHFATTARREFRGAIFTPLRIEGWNPEFPNAFFEYENVAVATAVSYFKPKGAAWGQHVVFMIYTPL